MNERLSINSIVEKIKPSLADWRKRGCIAREGWQLLANGGVIGLSEYDKPMHEIMVILEMLIKTEDIGFVASFAINEILYFLLKGFSDYPGITDILNDIKIGQANVALCITEENAGSDLSRLETRTEEQENGYILNGKKIYISNANIADYFIVIAKTMEQISAWRGISLFLVKRDTPGLTVRTPVNQSGAILLQLGEVELNDCFVEKGALLGKINRGFQYLMRILLFERLVLSILSVTAGKMIFKKASSYLKNRQLFGTKVSDYQNTRFVVAGYYSEYMMISSFLQKVVLDYDNGEMNKNHIMAIKIQSSDFLCRLALSMSQFHGGKIYLGNHWISNLYNEVRWTKLAAGANELLMDNLGENLMSNFDL